VYRSGAPPAVTRHGDGAVTHRYRARPESGRMSCFRAYGFRSPYRFWFDMENGRRLLVGDAGQELWEEVDGRAGGAWSWPSVHRDRGWWVFMADSVRVG
jgi:hypothetical protein